MKFVNKIAAAAEAANHHPDILINYNKVTLTLVSHDSGGVTQRDIRMAGKINELRASRSTFRRHVLRVPSSELASHCAARPERLSNLV